MSTLSLMVLAASFAALSTALNMLLDYCDGVSAAVATW